MKINKIRPKFYFLTKVEIKMTYLVFLFFTVSSPLEPFGLTHDSVGKKLDISPKFVFL